MSASEIIAGCILGGSAFDHRDRLDMAEEALSALTSAGYRFMAPGPLDAETQEAAAQAIETLTVPGYHPDDLYRFRDVTALAASAIRDLGTGDGNPLSMEQAAATILAQIEERFPNWRSYRDLLDCIDCTLSDLRRGA